MKNAVAAIIVLFHPNQLLLRRLLDSVESQVAHIIIVDNTPKFSLQDLKCIPESCSYYSLGENLGIAEAQNFGIKKALLLDASHILLLDQDSFLPKDMVPSLLRAESDLLKRSQKVGAIGPAFVDEKTGALAKLVRHKGFSVERFRPKLNEINEVDYIIASGSLIRLDVIARVGFMWSELFIDWVDVEWCLRAKKKGFRIFVDGSTIMHHSIGDEMTNFGGRDINLHSDFRNYFIVRNSAYLSAHSDLPINWRLIQFFKVPAYILFYSWHSRLRLYSLRLLLKAAYRWFRGLLQAP